MYQTIIGIVKYFLGFFILSICWSFCWWSFLVWKSTNNLFVLFLLLIEFVSLHYFIYWNTKQINRKTNKIALILSVIVFIAIGFYSHMSSQWLFEDFTEIISIFTGTISYMFGYTREHVDIIKVYGYIGCLDYMIMSSVMTYVWFIRLNKNHITEKIRKQVLKQKIK